MKLYIKNMVCDRCVLVIENVFRDLDIQPVSVSLGEVDTGDITLEPAQLTAIQDRIIPLGFELIDDRKSRLIEQIRQNIIGLVHGQDEVARVKLSEYLPGKLHHDYSYLSKLFSSVEGITLEQYLIHQKVEKVKELLVYDELSLTEIAYRLGYSSPSHLSSQFKKVTGMTPRRFKELKDTRRRQPLDKV